MALFEEKPIIVAARTPVARLQLNRPEVQNMINADVLRVLVQSFDHLRQVPGIRAVILDGVGEDFSAGLDVRSIMDLGPGGVDEFLQLASAAVHAVQSFPAPVIACIEGHAIGAGLELALACDVIIASADAKFAQPEANFGLTPAMEGIRRICERSGAGTAARLLFTGCIISGEEALRLRLVDYLVPHSELASRTQAIAEEIAGRAPLAVQGAKEFLRGSLDKPGNEARARAADLFRRVYSSQDREEGQIAFIQKRVPRFEGN